MEKSKEAKAANVSSNVSKATMTAKVKETSKEVSYLSHRLTEAERQLVCLRARGIKLWGVE